MAVTAGPSEKGDAPSTTASASPPASCSPSRAESDPMRQNPGETEEETLLAWEQGERPSG
jgi:hypothetical protein